MSSSYLSLGQADRTTGGQQPVERAVGAEWAPTGAMGTRRRTLCATAEPGAAPLRSRWCLAARPARSWLRVAGAAKGEPAAILITQALEVTVASTAGSAGTAVMGHRARWEDPVAKPALLRHPSGNTVRAAAALGEMEEPGLAAMSAERQEAGHLGPQRAAAAELGRRT